MVMEKNTIMITLKIHFPGHTSHISSAQEPHVVSGYCNGQRRQNVPTTAGRFIEQHGKDTEKYSLGRNQRADDLSREDRVLERKCYSVKC